MVVPESTKTYYENAQSSLMQSTMAATSYIARRIDCNVIDRDRLHLHYKIPLVHNGGVFNGTRNERRIDLLICSEPTTAVGYAHWENIRSVGSTQENFR